MSKKYLSQSELATFCGVTQPYISKLKNKGLFDDILEDGKFPRIKSTELARVIEDNKDETREPQRQANLNKKNGNNIPPPKKENPSNQIPKNNFVMFHVSYMGGDAQIELLALI